MREEIPDYVWTAHYIKLSEDEILAVLQTSNRWGRGGMPYMHDAAKLLGKLPLISVAMPTHMTMVLELARPLVSAEEMLALLQLNFYFPKAKDMSGEETTFNIAW